MGMISPARRGKGHLRPRKGERGKKTNAIVMRRGEAREAHILFRRKEERERLRDGRREDNTCICSRDGKKIEKGIG